MYVDNTNSEMPTLNPIAVTDIVEDIADEWTINKIAVNQYTIQNVATGKYVKVAGLSDTPVTLALPEMQAGSSAIIFVDAGYFFFYGINSGSNYLRQRNANAEHSNPYYESYSKLTRFDECFQFEEVENNPPTGLHTTLENDAVVAVQYYNLQGVRMEILPKGLYIVKKIYKSGKTSVSKTFSK
jgi:hypothetical protein